MIKYWYEERAHATMRASSLLRTRDETSWQTAPEQAADGSIAVGQNISLSDLGDVRMGDGVSGGNGNGDFEEC